MLVFTLYTSGVCGDRRNCEYPHIINVTDKEKLRTAAACDHVCADYAEHRRGISNFKESDVITMDVDNDHSENPAAWITPDSLSELFPDLAFAAVTSRSHEKQKGDKSPRPRFHVYFPIRPETDSTRYAALKRALYRQFPFFDGNALDAGRFLFGSKNAEVFWHEGQSTVDKMISLVQSDESIPEGRRNATLSRTAGKIVKRYGVTEEAYRMFLQQAERCDPPLEDSELATIWKSAGRFAGKVQAQPGYIPPELYGASLKPEDYSDIGQAKVLALDCGSELVYTDATDFLCYNGQYWVESRQKAVGLCESFLDRQLEDAKLAFSNAQQAMLDTGVDVEALRAGGKQLEKSITEDQQEAYAALLSAQAYRSFVQKRRDIKYITSALLAVKPMVQMEPKDLDRNENLLNCPDGTYDLELGLAGRRDHDFSDFITMCTPYAPGPEGYELWQQTLLTTFCGNTDLIEYVQRIVGLCAIGAVYQEALIIAYGDGSNGKSTFWNTISGAFGNYAGAISADTLTAGCKRNVRPELAECKGKRLLIAAELEEGMRLSTSVVKQLCSTDEISAEKKYKDPFKFRPTHTLVLYTNHLPRVGAMDTGIWRRLIVIPFDAKITGKTDIKNYSQFLLANAGPAITAWIIEGAEKAIADNYLLREPLCVHAAIEQYKADNDWLAHFLEACCVIDEDCKEKSGEIYASYRAYCTRTGEYIRSTSEFYGALDKRGFVRRRQNSGIMVYGLKLAEFEGDL